MPLQNRVSPDGCIHATPEKGLFMGNRGIIHDAATRTLLPRSRWKTRAWIICRCAFNGRKRTLMGRGSYTELFFTDEAVALAAGHRPCFECRRADARAFLDAFSAGQGRTVTTPQMDAILHTERRASRKTPPQGLSLIDLPSLPNGTFVASGGTSFLLQDRTARAWSFAGYGVPQPLSVLVQAPVTLVTPVSTVKALRAGYRPVISRTAA